MWSGILHIPSEMHQECVRFLSILMMSVPYKLFSSILTFCSFFHISIHPNVIDAILQIKLKIYLSPPFTPKGTPFTVSVQFTVQYTCVYIIYAY